MLVDKIAQFINHSHKAQSVLRGISKNPALAGATTSLILATTIRPASILAITKDKDDAKYGACSSISAGITEIVSSYALFKPMNHFIEKSSKQLYNTKGSIYFENPLLLRKYKSLTNRIGKLPLALGIALIRFSMIEPITKVLGKMGIVKSSRRGENQKVLDRKA